MTGTVPAATLTASALSCLTANLATYLGGSGSDALSRIARSVRLTVREGGDDLLAFVHHDEFLGRLDDGRYLTPRGTDDPGTLLAALDALLAADGRALVFSYSGSMPWSLAQPGEGAPHLLLVDGCDDDDRRHVDDRFRALLPTGVQEPYAGWITPDDLLTAMTAPGPVTGEQAWRSRLALGAELPAPGGRFRWLEPAAAAPSYELPGPPVYRTDTPAVLELLSDYYADFSGHPGRAHLIDDMWAAAQHHMFRYSHLLDRQTLSGDERTTATEAHQAWADLPLALFYAANAAARGKSRPAVVTGAFTKIREAEKRCAPALIRHGYLR